jgi:hypothetical protein
MRAIPGKLLRSGSRWFRYVVLRRGLRSEHRGVPLVMHRAGPDHVRACLEKVRAALDLIAEHDADRLTELRERFKSVLIWYGPAPANGSYLHSQRLCELNCEYVEKAEIEPTRVAMTLVHELTHARLMETADPKRPMSIPQAEWLCIGSEVAFAKKLPDAEHLVSVRTNSESPSPAFLSRM